MAYVKTNWQNCVTPVNADNMNKIENELEALDQAGDCFERRQRRGISMKRAFTIVELVIVIAIIAMLSAILIPSIANGADNAKEKIIDIYNGQTVRMIDNATDEVLYEGNDSTPPEGYTLVSVSVEDGIVIMYMEFQQTSETVSQCVMRSIA